MTLPDRGHDHRNRCSRSTGIGVHHRLERVFTINWNWCSRSAGTRISFITQNWRGKPLVSYQTIVQLIAATTTRAGLNVKAEIDNGTYPSGIKVTDAEMATLNISPHEFHGEWNYTIAPTASVM